VEDILDCEEVEIRNCFGGDALMDSLKFMVLSFMDNLEKLVIEKVVAHGLGAGLCYVPSNPHISARSKLAFACPQSCFQIRVHPKLDLSSLMGLTLKKHVASGRSE
jgi:hypothetical protein